MAWTRLWALIVKELLVVLRDPKSRVTLIVPPLIQLLIFAYASTLEVINVDFMVLDRDRGHWGAELTQRIEGAPTFRDVQRAEHQAEIREAIDRQRVLGAIVVGPTFSRDIEAGLPTDMQVILDGRRSNAAQIVGGYVSRIVAGLAAETAAGRQSASTAVRISPRNQYNPNLEFKWVTVPNLIASIALTVGLTLTALTIAREREVGTFDQLMVSPLRTHEILIGKLVPPILVGLFQVTLFVIAAIFVFHVPLRGSLVLLYGSLVFYLAAVVGIGLLISAVSKTQQQAFLGAFLFMVPAILLSGYAAPIENMPGWLQPLTLIDPLRYFLVIVKGVFLKDMPLVEVARQTLPLALIATATLAAAAWLFRRRSE